MCGGHWVDLVASRLQKEDTHCGSATAAHGPDASSATHS
jgi:hypothetical protein